MPYISKEPVYNSYLGLALLKTGNTSKALPYLNAALELFAESTYTDKDDIEIYDKLKNEIETAIQNNT